jgi:predicted Zn-dependent peptidase
LRKMASKGVTSAELERAKESVRGRITLALEESSDVADFLGKQELLTDTIRTPDQKLAAIMKVTQKDVQAVAKDVLRPGRLGAAIIGPFKDAKRFKKLLKF